VININYSFLILLYLSIIFKIVSYADNLFCGLGFAISFRALFYMVARDGIELPTQAFSGLWLLGPCYFTHVKSGFLISER